MISQRTTSFVFILAGVFIPLFVWQAGYDSFHEPKWMLLTGITGLLLILYAQARSHHFRWTVLDPPMLLFLAVTLFSWRWEAENRWQTLMVWLRLPVAWMYYHLLLAWLDQQGQSMKQRLLQGLLFGGTGVALLAILQDWRIYRWGNDPVSDWRFHLSSTLGNPNEVGGYMAYLLPIALAGWYSSKTTQGSFISSFFLLIFIYALTTVFTVGAWLGLFMILPISVFFLDSKIPMKQHFVLAALTSLGFFLLWRWVLQEQPNLMLKWGGFALGAIVFLLFLSRLFTKYVPALKGKSLLLVTGILLVWTVLFPPLGIPNHPRGLVAEALDSPRWKGGFGARQFIWRTTGLMVKDHPLEGIGWGNYFALHAWYQGEVYRQRNLPHDRPTVGIVPQAHSDPLQILAESGPLGLLAFFWLAVTVLAYARKKIHTPHSDEDESSHSWLAVTGLMLIGFHSLVDFPLRQPQPPFIALTYLALLTTRSGYQPSILSPIKRYGLAVTGIILVVWCFLGHHGQAALKLGFNNLMKTAGAASPQNLSMLCSQGKINLESIILPLPQEQDRWIYHARLEMLDGNNQEAARSLIRAGKYGHSLAWYQAWLDLANQTKNLPMAKSAVEGLLLYNPCWWGYWMDLSRIETLLGNQTEARIAREKAERFKVPEKPLP